MTPVQALQLAVNRYRVNARFLAVRTDGKIDEATKLASQLTAKYLYAMSQERGYAVPLIEEDYEFELLGWAQYPPLDLATEAVAMARVYNRAGDILGLSPPKPPLGVGVPWRVLFALGFGWYFFLKK